MLSFFLPLIAVLLMFSGLMLSGCEPSTQMTSSDTPMKPVSKGQQLFLSNCVSCHQGMGQPPGPNAVILKSNTLAQEASFKSLLRQPLSPMMPTFAPESLSDTDIHELYGYLHSEINKAPTE